MAFRGRGRGRGRGYGQAFAKEEPFELFPDIELPDRTKVPVDRNLIIWNTRLLNYWKSSAYYLPQPVEKKSLIVDIERYSDWSKPKATSNRGSLDQFLVLKPTIFPEELVKDSKEPRGRKRVRWNRNADEKLDMLEKLEEKMGQKDEKEKEDKEDAENDGEVDEAEEEYSDDGDYNQNEDFDDDEDDYNMEDGGDEPEL